MLLSPLFTFAQSNYKPGYVINTKGDTLRGVINLKEWDTNPRNISFKTAVNDKQSRTLGPGDITFFKFTDLDSYQRYTGPINDDPTSLNSIPTGRITTSVTDSVFLKIAQKGDKVTLYIYVDTYKTHFFIADNQDNTPAELVYRTYTNDGKIVNENGYMRQLYTLAQKYNASTEALKTQIERSEYKLSDLQNITAKINGATGKNAEKIKTLNKSTTFFAGLGLNAGTTTLTRGLPYLYKLSKTSYFPRIAFGFNVLANPNVGRFVFRVEAAFTANKYSSDEPIGDDGTITYKLDQYNISLVPQILFNFYNADDLKFYAGAGLSLNFSQYKGNTVIYALNNGEVSETKNYLNPEKSWATFPFKLGTVINKKLDISVAYLPPVGITQNSVLKNKAIQIGVNYSFH